MCQCDFLKILEISDFEYSLLLGSKKTLFFRSFQNRNYNMFSYFDHGSIGLPLWIPKLEVPKISGDPTGTVQKSDHFGISDFSDQNMTHFWKLSSLEAPIFPWRKWVARSILNEIMWKNGIFCISSLARLIISVKKCQEFTEYTTCSFFLHFLANVKINVFTT